MPGVTTFLCYRHKRLTNLFVSSVVCFVIDLVSLLKE
jgi:hypothetical protein